MKKIIGILLAVGLIASGSIVGYAQGIEDVSLLFVDVPEVITSTLSSLSLNKVPSIMTVVSEDEINLSGAKTLGELIHYIPGMEMQFGTIMDGTISVRGIRSSDSNAKVLFMVDGHPMNSPSTGNWYAWGVSRR